MDLPFKIFLYSLSCSSMKVVPKPDLSPEFIEIRRRDGYSCFCTRWLPVMALLSFGPRSYRHGNGFFGSKRCPSMVYREKRQDVLHSISCWWNM